MWCKSRTYFLLSVGTCIAGGGMLFTFLTICRKWHCSRGRFSLHHVIEIVPIFLSICRSLRCGRIFFNYVVWIVSSLFKGSWGNAVSIVTGYWVNDWPFIHGRDFSLRHRDETFWGVLSFISIEYRGLFSWRWNCRSVKLIHVSV
jgi:hypothetical protein